MQKSRHDAQFGFGYSMTDMSAAQRDIPQLRSSRIVLYYKRAMSA